MKKIKKILSLLSAMVVMAVGSMSVSAFELVNFDNIIFSSKKYTSNSYYAYHEFFIDENGSFYGLSAAACALAVKMKDGCKPPEGYERNLNSENPDGVKIMEIITVEELTTYQKAVLKHRHCGMGGAIELTDIELTDNLYLVSGFRGGYKAVTEYCEKLLESSTVEFAVPLISGEYNYCGPAILKDLKESEYFVIDLDTDKFFDGYMLFLLSFENAEQAESFDTGSIEGFEEKLYAMQVIDNNIYFQFKENVDGLDIGYMLNTLQNTEPVKAVDCVAYAQDETSGGYINGVPESYEMGDLNFDGTIGIADAVCLSKSVVKQIELTEEQYLIADVNEDGTVNVFDSIALSRKLLKK